MLEDCAAHFCRIWLDRAGEDYEYADCAVRLEGGEFAHTEPGVGIRVQPINDHAVAMALGSARLAATRWRESYRQLPLLYPALPPLPELWERLCNPSSLPGTPFRCGTRVEVWCGGSWYPATVAATHANATVSVTYVEVGFWGTGARHLSTTWSVRVLFDGA